jgi:hypothetical protein
MKLQSEEARDVPGAEMTAYIVINKGDFSRGSVMVDGAVNSEMKDLTWTVGG